MSLTAEAMSQLDENIDFRQMAAMRAILADRFGLLPGAPFKCEGTFVRNNYEVIGLRCMAMLPSGWMIDIDESVSVSVPMLYGTTYYLAIGLSENLKDFEHKDVEFLRPEYSCCILSADELAQNDVIPVTRFIVKNDVMNVSPSYIPPCLMLSSSEKFEPYIKQIASKLKELSDHPNMDESRGKRVMLRQYIHLNNLNQNQEVRSFIENLGDIADALRFYIVEPNVPAEIIQPRMKCDYYDVQLYLEWIVNQIDYAKSILDKTPLEEKKPDFDELKAILRKELTEELSDIIEEKVTTRVDALREDIQAQVSEALKDFLSGEFRRQLYADLDQNLSENLYQKLYDALYQALHDALYREEEIVVDDFTPMI